mgnify:CR=1 FL=1
MTRLEQSRTYQKTSDPTQEGTHEKPNQARTCQEGTGEKRPEQYRPKLIDQNKPARTDQTKLKRTAWTRADQTRTMRPETNSQTNRTIK